ncbi:unnamed protein product [Dimorphilus gyrociliatus]|uniref:Uncharacterized protein n=1 Tax=Dimorphilus gyrociliatus TaxID=2664684 RepID=A0A7I8VG08_9ANNE|nr:unnamed protein product [Dimorphilus gyrociliatus]
MIQQQFKRLKINREKRIESLDRSIKKHVVALYRKRNRFVSEIDVIYEKNKSELKQTKNVIKDLLETTKNMEDTYSRDSFRLNIKDYLESCINEMHKAEIYDKYSFLSELDKVKIVEHTFERPISELSFQLVVKPRKIIDTKVGFLVLLGRSRVYALFSEALLVEDDNEILDICPTYNRDLAYIQYIKGVFYYKEVVLEGDYINERIRQRKGIPLVERDSCPSMAIFCVFKDSILLKNENSFDECLFKKSNYRPMSYLKDDRNDLFQYSKDNYKTFPHGLCRILGSFIEYYSSEAKFTYLIRIVPIVKEYPSVSNEIISKLNEGYEIFSIRNQHFLVHFGKKVGFSLDNDAYFNGKILLEYRIEGEMVMFCLTDKDKSKNITIDRYLNLA